MALSASGGVSTTFKKIFLLYHIRDIRVHPDSGTGYPYFTYVRSMQYPDLNIYS